VNDKLSGDLMDGFLFKSQIDNRFDTMLYSKNDLVDLAGILMNCCSLNEISFPRVVELKSPLLMILELELPMLDELLVNLFKLFVVVLLVVEPIDVLVEYPRLLDLPNEFDAK
jgi:hypothetical protein